MFSVGMPISLNILRVHSYVTPEVGIVKILDFISGPYRSIKAYSNSPVLPAKQRNRDCAVTSLGKRFTIAVAMS